MNDTYNNQFKEVIDYLGVSQKELATQLSVSQVFISTMVTGKNEITHSIIKKLLSIDKLSNSYKTLNINWLLTGNGSMFIEKQTVGNAALIGDVMGKANVTVSSIAVNGGGGVPSQIVEVQNLAFIPFVRGGSVAFPLQGKSMCPVFESGDWLICSTVNRHEDIKATNIYVVKLTDGTLYCKYIDKKGAVWLLRSEDWRNYPNIEVSTNDIEKVYQIDQRITSVFGWNN